MTETWEEALMKEDESISYNLHLIVHNFETNKGEDIKDREEDREHPREREREKRIKNRAKERERRFKEKEKEWVRREEAKERERYKEKEKEEERLLEKTKCLKRDLEYDSDDELIRRRKLSKKFARAREERRKIREKEKIDDEIDARREFELLYPGVATAEEKLQQAAELEEKNRP